MENAQPETPVLTAELGAWRAIARILRPRGRRGEVVAEVLTDFPDRFERQRRAFIETPAGAPEPAEIAESWWHGEQLVLRLEGIESISEAEKLQGRLLLVPSEEQVKLAPGQYYVSDLVGCDVVCDGRRIGEITRLETTGGTDILCVQKAAEGETSGEILIPFAQEICTEIDLAARRIRIDPPEGLLELNSAGSGNPET